MNNAIFHPSQLTSNSYRCEYLVIGSGAGGSVAAMELAEAGKDVIVIEEGLHFQTADFTNNISDMTQKTWRNNGITPIWGKPTIGFAEGKCVGGSTVINGGLLWRTPQRMLDIWANEYGILGYTNDDLIPHFEKIEQILNVSYHKKDDQNIDSDVLTSGCDALDWNYVPVPRAGGAACINSNLCPTGCPAGAKQSTALTYIPRAIKAGAKIFTGSKAIQINKHGNLADTVKIKVKSQEQSRVIDIKSDFIFLSGGAIQTPFLLQKSKINANVGKKLEFHFNLKFVAEFDREINAENGTIFTVQVQEYMDEGLLIMASNYRPHYLAMTLAHFGNNTINEVMEKYNHCGLYVAQVQAQSKARIISAFRTDPFVHYNFDPADESAIKDAIKKTVKLLFHSGAKKIYLPIVGSMPVTNSGASLNKAIQNLKPKDLEIVSVHAMASCPMGNDGNSVTDLSGKIHGFKNIYITDASILPSNIGESPQGTIMAISHEIIKKNIGE